MPRGEATEAFLHAVLAEVRWKQAHAGIAKELSDHIEDQCAKNRHGGMTSAEAETAAIADMGDPLELGARFDAAYRPRPTWQVLLPAGLALLCGVLLHILLYAPLVYFEAYRNEALIREALALVIGGLCFLAAYRMNFYRVAYACWPLYALIAFAVWYPACGAHGAELSAALCALLLLPMALSGIVYALRRTGLWAVLIAALLLALPLLRYGQSGNVWTAGACALTCLAALLAAVRLRILSRTGLWALPAGAVSLALAVLLFYDSMRFGLGLLLLLICFLAALCVLLSEYKGKARIVLLLTLLVCAALAVFLSLRFPLQNALRALLDAGDPLAQRENVRTLLAGTRWLGKGSLERLPENALWFCADPAERWRLAVAYLPLYVCYACGRAPALLLISLPAAAIVFGGLRVCRLSGRLGRLIGTAALVPLGMQWIWSVLASIGIVYEALYPIPFLSVSFYALIADMALLGVICSVLRTDDLH